MIPARFRRTVQSGSMDRDPAPPIDYAPPPAATSLKPALQFWLPQLVCWGALTGGIAWLSLQVVPVYAAMVNMQKVNLPEVTRWIIALCSVIHRYRLWVLFPALTVLPPLWVYHRTRRRPEHERQRAVLWSAATAIILMMALTLYVLLALVVPMLPLMRSLGDPFGNPPGWDTP
jgi:hypothetical protein